MKHFKSPRKLLSEIDPEKASRLIALASDIALIVDKRGVIRDVACADEDLDGECGKWVGRPFVETVTVESKPKAEELLRDAAQSGPARWRQVNHQIDRSPDLPVRYTAVELGSEGRIVVVGRDLRTLAALQQRLLTSQAQVERELDQIRSLETRYRTLFQLSGEAILIVDAASGRIIEANPAAHKLVINGTRKVVGRPIADIFVEPHQGELQSLLASTHSAPSAREAKLQLGSQARPHMVSVSLHKQGADAHYLVRITPHKSDRALEQSAPQSSILRIIERLPDGFVTVDKDRRIVTANESFVQMTQLATESQLRGEPIDRWLGRVSVDVDVLIANLKEHGSLRRYQTVVRGEYGGTTMVEVTGVSAAPYFGLAIHQAEQASVLPHASLRALPRPIEQLTELVGRAPLKEVVRHTTDIIERMCIEAALSLTGDNRASAAELLGLSRQSLYVKLRRYGIDDSPQA